MDFMSMDLLIAAALGLLAGGALGALLMSGRGAAARAGLQGELDEVRRRVAEAHTALKVAENDRDHFKAAGDQRVDEIAELRRTEAAMRGQLAEADRTITEAKTALTKERQAHEEKIRELTGVREGIEKNLAVLANDLLEKNADGFMKRAKEFFEGQNKQSKESVETLVKPIGEALKTYQDKLGEMEQARKTDEGAIKQELKQLAETHLRLNVTTSNLVNALRSAPKTRGRWGEQQLKTVLEMAGMMEYVDFLTEYSVDGEEGRKLRPDVVLRLPGGRQIVVDAKTPMSAYLDAVEAVDEETREAKLKLHTQQMRTHAQQLGSKQYWDLLAEAPDFVVMFVPGDNLYSAAIERDPDLFEFAYDRQVIIATPTTFLALAKAIAFGWRQERVSQNAQKVLTEGGELYRRLQGLGKKMVSMTKALDTTVARHNDFVASLESRVLPQGRKLHEMGIATSVDDIPELAQVEKLPRHATGRDLDLSEDGTPDDDTPEADSPDLLTGSHG